MNQGGHSLPYKPVFTAAPSQPEPHPYVNQDQSSDRLNPYHFLSIPRIPSHQIMSSLLHPPSSLVAATAGPSNAHKSEPETSSNALGFHFYDNSLVLPKPLMASVIPHLPSSQLLQEPVIPSGVGAEKEIICIGMKPAIGNDDGTEASIAKKPRNFSNEGDAFPSSREKSSVPKVQAPETHSQGKECSSVSSPAVSSTTEAENEIVELKAKIDSLYAKLNEIQRKHNPVEQGQSNISKCKNSSSTASSGSSRSSSSRNDDLKYGKETAESAFHGSTRKVDAVKPKQLNHESPARKQNQGTQKPESATTDSTNPPELKAQEVSPQLCDAWESNGEFWATELPVLQKIKNPSKIFQKTTTTFGVGADGGIILANCSQEMPEQEVKNDKRNSTNNQHTEHTSPNSVRSSKDRGRKDSGFRPCGNNLQQKFNTEMDANLKMRLAFLAARRKVSQYRSNGSQKPETNDTKKESTIIGVKRIQEFRDAICSRPLSHDAGKTVQNLDTACSGHGANHCFSPDSRLLPTQLPIPARLAIRNPHEYPMLSFPQPAAGFTPPMQFGPTTFFPGISTSLESHPYFANPGSQLLHPEQFRYLAQSQPAAHFLQPSVSIAPSLARQQRPSTLLTGALPTAAAGMSATAKRPASDALVSQNIRPEEQGIPTKNGGASKRKSMRTKPQKTTSAPAVFPSNNIVNVPNPVKFDHIVGNEQAITKIENPWYASLTPICQQMMMEASQQSAQVTNLTTPQANLQAQQRSPNTWSVVTLPLPTMLHDGCNCFS